MKQPLILKPQMWCKTVRKSLRKQKQNPDRALKQLDALINLTNSANISVQKFKMNERVK